jgi:hypothetical protein
MSDVEFLEVLTIENLQREDVHPLEEAQGFADLIKHGGYDVGKIADRIGKSHRYVYDRLRLLQLTDELQQIFFDGEITAGHAVLLARLSSADQARVLKETGALFTHEHGHRLPGEAELDLNDRRKPMSVHELQRWIDQYVRFDVAAPDVPELFPETAALVTPAVEPAEKAEKVISITHNYHVDPGAKPEDGERTYTSSSWKRADGERGSKTCDRSVIGVIVVGPDRGQAFKVCVDKKKCAVHWKAEMKEAAQRATQREEGGESTPAVVDRHAVERARQEEQRKADEAKQKAFTDAAPRIREALAAQLSKRTASPAGPLGQLLIAEVKSGYGPMPTELKPGSTSEDLVRYLAFLVLSREIKTYGAHKDFPKRAKQFGVDVAAILKGDTTPRFPAKKAAKKKAKRSTAARAASTATAASSTPASSTTASRAPGGARIRRCARRRECVDADPQARAPRRRSCTRR